MGRRAASRSLTVWMNGERVGVWTIGPSGVQELSYDAAWLDSPHARPLSLSLPLRPGGEAHRGVAVRSWFENLLPDNDAIRERLQARFSTSSTQAFDLLAEVGRDCVGAVQLLPVDAPRPRVRTIEASPLSDADVGRLLEEAPTVGRHADFDDFRISLAGAQEKIALLHDGKRWLKPNGSTPTTHILKLPIGSSVIDLSASIENEWLCSLLLRELGVPVAECEPRRFGSVSALVVKRFDRRWSDDGEWIIRLPQEDLAQATGRGPGLKYESDGGPGIRELMALLRSSTESRSDQVDFFRSQVVFWLLCAIDGHAKNFSVFLEPGGQFRLTPRYDVISAYPVLGRGQRKLARQKVKMAMAVWGKDRHYRWSEIQRKHFEHTAKDCGIAEGDEVIDQLGAAVPSAVDRAAARLPKGFPTEVATPILEGVLAAARALKASPK